ncbi:MAG: Response regulator containing a CheY-like receiver domain and a domain protein [Bacteroidetes bacterium]|jgi:PAS domain S-box-containing protein|nr:Response regulator containing a CheY-like receiver domain and a domain protein [Bacteroidota bacterium]
MRKTAKVLLFLALIPFLSLKGQYSIKNFQNLLPKKNVPFNCISQDKQGYLWLGSNEGLVRFDGKSSLIFNQKNGLPAAKITSVFCDADMFVWIGTSEGKVYFINPAHRIDSLSFGKEVPENKITGFYKSETGKLFVSTYGNGIYTFENSKLLQHYTSKNGMSDDVVYCFQYVFNTIWCGTDAGITKISNTNKAPSFEIVSSKNGLPDNIVRSISEYKDNKLVIGTQDSGVCFFDVSKKQFQKPVFFSEWDKGAVVECSSVEQGGLVFITEKKGLFLLQNGQLYSQDFFAGLKTTEFNDLFIDNSHSIWLTSKSGAHQVAEKRFEFINAAKGLTDEKILSVICDNNGTIWAGSQTGLVKLNKDEQSIFSVTTVKDFPKGTVSCSAIDDKGTLYFGTYENGLIAMINNNPVVFNSKNSALPNDNVSNLFINNEKIYVSTIGGGLAICELNENKLNILKTYSEENGLKSNYIYSTVLNSKGELFVASDGGGLEKLVDDKFVSVTEGFKLKSNTIYSLCKDAKDNIWAVTNSDGLIKYDGSKIYYFNQKTGLRDEQPLQITEANGIIYALHSKGIDKINSINGQISYYDVLDGDLEPSLNSVYIREGILYSATSNGILVYRVKPSPADQFKPLVVITNFLVNYKKFPLDSVHELKYNQNNLSFEFSGLWLKNPDKLLYRYKVEGFDADWKYSPTPQLVNYNNLDAGTYSFIVQSKNDEDVWSEPITYDFTILLPLWKRWWFWLIVVAITGVGIYSFIQWRIKALQKENLILEEKVTQRTAEIEKQSKIIEEANKELEQLSLVASKTDNIVLILDPEGYVEYVNDSFEKLNNITLEEILAERMNIFKISNSSKIREVFDEAVQNRKSVKYEALNTKNPGFEVWEASTLTPIYDEDGKLKKVIIIDSDVTETKRQQKIIEQKNKDITDSIEYARKIQTAILPAHEKIRKYMPYTCVFYKTKDIVSGDFYWFSEKEDFCLIATVDCTGHGVPGAFMSLIGYNILNRIANEANITDPSQILKNLNLGVLDALHKNRDSDSKDGMDAAICKFYYKENKIEYAGAMRPLWIVNNEGLREIKADKIPIGTKQDPGAPEINYTTHTLTPAADEVFYIFTDGYSDQFGGEKDKKMGSARFKELLINIHKTNFNEQEKTLLVEHNKWKGENEQVDDMLVIGFKK